MKVRDIMTQPPQTCRLDTDIATASRRMHDHACGTLVVLDKRGRVAGMVTDRDIAIAIGDTTRPPAYITVAEVMSHKARTCTPGDELGRALATMAELKVRRLPVVNIDGDLKGVLSIDDVILWGVEGGGVAVEELLNALRSICIPQNTLVERA
jgi:CBS domain-containing protein